MSFDENFARVVGLEGGYSNNPADRGGPTKFGITEQVARAYGYKDDMKDLPLGVAKFIYRGAYWDALKLDDVEFTAPKVAAKLFDQGVNQGVGTAGRYLQRALNVLNRGAKDYPDLVVDGAVGMVTIADFKAFIAKRGGEGADVLFRVLNCLQGARYVEISEKDQSQEEFTYGWFKGRIA